MYEVLVKRMETAQVLGLAEDLYVIEEEVAVMMAGRVMQLCSWEETIFDPANHLLSLIFICSTVGSKDNDAQRICILVG